MIHTKGSNKNGKILLILICFNYIIYLCTSIISNEVLPYIVRHEALVRESNQKMTKNRVLKEHNKTFLNWFKDIIFGDDNASEMLRKLADEPKRNIRSW